MTILVIDSKGIEENCHPENPFFIVTLKKAWSDVFASLEKERTPYDDKYLFFFISLNYLTSELSFPEGDPLENSIDSGISLMSL